MDDSPIGVPETVDPGKSGESTPLAHVPWDPCLIKDNNIVCCDTSSGVVRRRPYVGVTGRDPDPPTVQASSLFGPPKGKDKEVRPSVTTGDL